MEDIDDIQVHELSTIEQNLEVAAHDADSQDGNVVAPESGFMIVSASGFMIV
jgi:hypothetical protein